MINSSLNRESDRDEPQLLSVTQKMWLAVLKRLAASFPLSPYAELGAEAIDTARIWSAELPGVPHDAVVPLYERLSKSWLSPFPPNVADFRRVWIDWDFFVEVNAPEEEFGGEPIAALMPGPKEDDGPKLKSTREQFKHMAARGHFVCCLCRDAHGVSPTALRTPDEKFWVCAEGRCEFQVPFVPIVARGEKEPEVAVEAEEKPVPKPAATRPKSPAEQLADIYEIPFESCDPRQVAALSGFAKWLSNDFSSTKEMFPTINELHKEWAEWKKEQA